MPINQPSNQIKFTNVSIVRLKKGKKRFELACYKNKLLEYRSGAEKDLDNVLQVPTIFLSVSKAQTAPAAEVAKAFGANVKPDEARQEILRKGEVQVGERERKEMSERVEKEMLDIVSGRLVDPTTKRVYTPGMIAKALDQLSSASGHLQQQQQHYRAESTERVNVEERPSRNQSPRRNKSPQRQASPQGKSPPQNKPLWTGVAPNKSAKSQALEAMKALIAWQPIPVMKARMRLRVTCPVTLLKQPVKAAPAAGGATKEKETELPEVPSSKPNNKKGGKSNKRSARKGDPDDTEAVSDAEPTPPQKPTNKKGNRSNKRSARKGGDHDIESGSDAERQPFKPTHKKGDKSKKSAQKGNSNIQSDSDELQAPTGGSHARRRSPSPARPTTPTKTTTTEPTEPPSPTKAPNTVKAKILSHIESVDKEEVKYDDEWEVVGYAEPGAFKTLNELVSLTTKGRGRVEVLDMTVTKEE